MVKVILTNQRNTPFSLANEFTDVVMLKAELSCCDIHNSDEVRKIINKYSRYAKWTFKMSTPDSIIFKAYDCWDNLHYLIVEEKENKKHGKK